jgi:hypothetical protein
MVGAQSEKAPEAQHCIFDRARLLADHEMGDGTELLARRIVDAGILDLVGRDKTGGFVGGNV